MANFKGIWNQMFRPNTILKKKTRFCIRIFPNTKSGSETLLLRDVHGNVDRLSCSDCGKLFTSKRSLFGHKKEKHSGAIEIFTCPDCGKNFSRKSNLKVTNNYALNINLHRYQINFFFLTL